MEEAQPSRPRPMLNVARVCAECGDTRTDIPANNLVWVCWSPKHRNGFVNYVLVEQQPKPRPKLRLKLQ
jgi:hypothetical protein